ncbi:uncharacterized protein LOC115046593 isoform X2 [Echeneis naucrates]|nr:uncharacterized protein LOC115046593 isoform X2 [Echeneis naucrates]XP_029362929.1 uncharacterized protein LOC115046593 isoform X2 [Echeneis naucrates]XP_029362930.1 uncharacterized protein LOC115046593 isoform X2 [Echeneis naucrates]
MDTSRRLEIYIPAEAEVKSIPLLSLPNSMLRRMGLALSDSKGSTSVTDSPEVICICPVTLRRKGQKPEESMSLLGREFQAASNPQPMSFVSSNRMAFEILRDTQGKKGSAYRPHNSLSPQASAPEMRRSAIVIYQGQTYLSIKKPNRHQRQPTSKASTLTSKSQKEGLLNANRLKKKHTMFKVTQSNYRKDAAHKVRAVSPSRSVHSALQSTGSVHEVDTLCHKDVRGEVVAEEAATLEPAQPEGENEAAVSSNNTDGCKMMGLDGEEPMTTTQNSDDNNKERELLTAAHVSPTLLKGFDFEQLAQEEMIAHMKARLRKNEAALNAFTNL